MEKKQPKEQIAFNYRNPASSRPAGEHELPATTKAGSRRVVTVPREVVQPTHWADRQVHMRRAHVASHARRRIVKRTLAQTGTPAPGGTVRLIRPLPRQPLAAPVPVRRARRNARKGSFWRRILGLFALLVIGIVGVSFALTSSNFRVHVVNVVGTQNLTLVHNIQNMGMQNQNIFLLDVVGLTARIEALPVVASAKLDKQLPDQLTITIVERTPVLLWQTQQGTFSVDNQGVVIAPASETTGTDHLMTIVDTRGGAAAQQVRPGFRLNAADIAFATQLFARLPQLPGVSPFTLRYDVVPEQGGHETFIVVRSDGWLAYLGNADDPNPLENRLIELQQILSLAQQKQLNLATIDVRFGLRPVFTLKS